MVLRHLLAGLTLLTALTLFGCGQKGSLYMPDQVPPSQQAGHQTQAQSSQPCRTPSCAALQIPASEKNQDSDEATDQITPEENPE